MKHPTPAIEIDQDLAFQRREWRAQRIGWWGLTVFVTLAAAGLFGDGPLSHARAGEPGQPLWIEYERFVRRGASTRLVVHGRVPHADQRGVELHIARDYFEAIRIERLTPEPASIAVGETSVRLQFARDILRDGAFTVAIDLEPLRAGRHRPAVGIGGSDVVTLSQLAYF